MTYEVDSEMREIDLRDGRTAKAMVIKDYDGIFAAWEWVPGRTGHPTASGRKWAADGIRLR